MEAEKKEDTDQATEIENSFPLFQRWRMRFHYGKENKCNEANQT